MNFGALSRGFGTCCLRFKNRVATIPAKLASGWLARLYREGVEPSGSLQKVSDHISRPPFLDLSWRKGSFMMMPPKCVVSLPVSRGRFESFASGRPSLARSGGSLLCQSSDAIGGEADMPRPPAPYRSDATDPTAT